MNISTIISFYIDYTHDIQLHNYDMVYDVIKQSTSPACSSCLYHHDIDTVLDSVKVSDLVEISDQALIALL